MITHFFESLVLYFRKHFINSLKEYSIKSTPENFDNYFEQLPEFLQKEFIKESDRLDQIHLAKKFYLINFNEGLTTVEAMKRIDKLGLTPANLLETVIFLSKYGETIKGYPIISLNAYRDEANQFSHSKGYRRKWIDQEIQLTLCCTSQNQFATPGEIEFGESAEKSRFFSGVQFLVKEAY